MDLRTFLTLAGILVGIFLFHVKNVKEDLKEGASREYFLKKLIQPTYETLYFASVNRVLDWTDSFFHEKKPFSHHTFVSILPITLSYCLWFFIIAWALGGSGAFGTAQLLPKDTPQWQRLLVFFQFGTTAVLPLWFIKSFWRRAYADEASRSLLASRFDSLPEVSTLKFPRPLLILVILFVITQSCLVTWGLFSIRESASMALTFPAFASLVILSGGLLVSAPIRTHVDVQLFKIGAVAFLFLFIAGGLGIGLMFYVDEKLLPYIASLITFCFALPGACALSDFISWGIARSLGRHLVSKFGPISLFFQIVLNGLAAVICILIGTVALVSCIDWIVGMFKIQRNFSFADVGVVISVIEKTPTHLDTAWLLGPLAMTMLPLFMHLVAVLAGLMTLTTPIKLRDAVAKRIAGNPASAQLTLPAIYLASIPWISIAAVLLVTITAYVTFDTFRTHIFRQLVYYAQGTHDIITAYQKPLATIGLLIVLPLWIHYNRKNVPQKKETTNKSSPPLKKAINSSSSLNSKRKRHKRRTG